MFSIFSWTFWLYFMWIHVLLPCHHVFSHLPWHFDIAVYKCTQLFYVADPLISSSSPVSGICILLFSKLLVLISYLYMDDFLCLCFLLPVRFSICSLLDSSCGLFFSTYRSPLSICCKGGLVVLNSLSFCLSVKLLISPLNLNESLAG